jgi:hypothetical protein
MKILCAAPLILLIALPTAALPADTRFDLGVRGSITAADGEPANDIPGVGVLGHYALNADWTVGLAVDRTEFDFEEPAKLLGITQDQDLEAIDSVAESTVVSAWVERTYAMGGGRTLWYLGAGVGAASVDVPDVSGARADGGQFLIHTEADTEIIASALGGVRRVFGQRWYGEVGVRVDQHFADWRFEDRISGASGTVDDYLAFGGHVAIGLRF